MDELQINKLNVTHGVLYGRDSEVGEISDALTRIAEKQSRLEILLISGSSGTGKSALARKLQRPTERLGGCFVSGKFDQNRLLPYSAFGEALSDLCTLIRNKSDVIAAVQEAVGAEGARVLLDVIPGVAPIFDRDGREASQRHEESAGYLETQQVLNYSIRSFLTAVSDPERPVVVLLDDLQWADEPSLKLLETLTTNSDESCGLLFVICHRDTECEGSSDEIVRRLNVIVEKARDAAVNRVHLDNLTRDVVRELVAEMLRSDVPGTIDLADLVFDKTRGNPFFVVRFLQSLKDEEILNFSLGALKWNYSLEAVRRKSVTDNVASFMVSSMQRLPQPTHQMLTVASLLGAQFEIRTLRKTADNGEHLDEILRACVDLGLLQVIEESMKYGFVHDQIRSAAKALIPPKDLAQQQFTLGLVLLKQSTPEDEEADLFIIVDLLNAGVSHTKEKGIRHRLALLNFRAGQKSMSLSAFDSALSYLEVAEELLADTGWAEHHGFCVELFSLTAEAANCTGDFERLNHSVDVVLNHGKDLQEKYRTYHALLNSLSLKAHYTEAVDLGLLVLKQLGYVFPKHPGKARVVVELLKTQRLLKKYTQEDLESLPEMTHPNKLKAMRIIDKMSTCAYIVRPNLLALMIFRSMQWSILDGVSKYAAMVFTGYGMIVSSALCDLKGAYMFGQVARSIVNRFGANDLKTRIGLTTIALVDHWTQPAAQSIKPLLSIFQEGLATTGDVENSMWSLLFAHDFMIESGQNLSLIDESYRKHEDVIKAYNQETIAMQSLPFRQYVQNLMGMSEDPLLLTGEAMVEEAMFQKVGACGDPLLECFLYFLRSWLACYFNNFESAISFMNRARPLESIVMSQHWCPRHAFFVGLASFAFVRQKQRKSPNLWKSLKSRRGDASIRKLKKWISHGNCNCVHLNLLLEAERLALKGKHGTKEKFDAAIASASKRGYVQDKALASERAGLFFLDNREEEWASHYLSMSRELYSCWGAKAKVEQLDRSYSSLLQSNA